MRYEVNPSRVLIPKIVSCDTEYTSLNFRTADLLSVSIGVNEDLTYIFDVCHLNTVKHILENCDIILSWNMVVDWFQLNKTGYDSGKSKWLDGMLLEHLINENLDHGLGDFALREFGDGYKKAFWSKYETYQEAPKETQYEYEMRDGCYTFAAGVKYNKLLTSKFELIRHVHRLQWALFDTEIKGIRVDVKLIKKTKSEMYEKIQQFIPKLRSEFKEYCDIWEMEKWCEEISKRKSDKGKLSVERPVFSFASDKQLSGILYGEKGLHLPITEKTKKGNPSTSYETLQKLAEIYPEIQTIVDYKETKSVYSTFVEGMLDRVEVDRIYPHFNVNGTNTGRISHSNPNMGNLPREGVIRNFFLPDYGHVLVGADYSQLEVVIEANLTEDKSLLKIILEGASKHDITAEGLGISRDSAKTLNFALQYGAGVHKVSKILSISNRDAQDIFDRYWKLYSGVKTLKDVVCKQLADSGQVTNLFGRTRHFETPRGEFERAKQQRQAYNFLIQGPGSDMMNRATYLTQDKLKSKGLGRVLFSVHDELVCEVYREEVDQAKQYIVESLDEPNSYLNLKYPVGNKLYGPLERWEKG